MFDPPTYVVASLRDAIASLGETRPRERSSTAAAQTGIDQAAAESCNVIRQPLAQVVPFNPQGPIMIEHW